MLTLMCEIFYKHKYGWVENDGGTKILPKPIHVQFCSHIAVQLALETWPVYRSPIEIEIHTTFKLIFLAF